MNAIDKRPCELFQRKDSPNWWMRFSITGHGQIRIPLRTPDPELSGKLAEKEYQKAIWSAEAGVLQGKTSFSKLAAQHLERIEKLSQSNLKHRTKYHYDEGIIERHLRPISRRKPSPLLPTPGCKNISNGAPAVLDHGSGKERIRDKYERDGRQISRPAQHIGPALSTLRREAVTLRSVFKQAVTLGYIKAADIPAPELAPAPKNKRPAVTEAEIQTLLEQATNRIAIVGSPDNSERMVDAKTRFERMMLWGFIQIAVITGMRPTELHNLSWANV